MADFKQSLQAAHRWLHRAEDELDREHGIRAKLHLMLAEAELKRVSDHKSSNRRMTRIAAIFLTAAIIASYAWWSFAPNHPLEKNTQLTAAEQAVKVTEPKSAEPLAKEVKIKSVEAPVGEVASPQIDKVAAQETMKFMEKKNVVKQETIVSADEMQNLVRTAGKTLRSQPKVIKE